MYKKHSNLLYLRDRCATGTIISKDSTKKKIFGCCTVLVCFHRIRKQFLKVISVAGTKFCVKRQVCHSFCKVSFCGYVYCVVSVEYNVISLLQSYGLM